MEWMLLVLAQGVWEPEARAGVAAAWIDGGDVDGAVAGLGLRYALPSGAVFFARWEHAELGGRDVKESGEHTDGLCVLFTFGLGDCTWHDTKRTRKIDLETDELTAGVGWRTPFSDPAWTMDYAAAVGVARYRLEMEETLVSKGVLLHQERGERDGWGPSARLDVLLGYAASPGLRLQAGVGLGLTSVVGPTESRHTATTLGVTLGFALCW